MAKEKIVYFCKSCGQESARWLGQCPACKEWNTFVEAPQSSKSSLGVKKVKAEKVEAMRLDAVKGEEEERICTGIGELDRVLGGGIVIGSLVLVGGDPGIGKSTLLLQMCYEITRQKKKVLYVSGEESLRQIKMRAERLFVETGELLLLSETNLDQITEVIRELLPQVVIIDSIQTMYREEAGATAGSVSQIKEATAILMQLAKTCNITIFIVGHVTKEGVVAGPRMLEHMVDTVLYFEGEQHASYRILRAVKNRFGSTNEIGVFEMRDSGLKEVKNASEYMLEGKPEEAPGSVVTAAIEGTRPILVEVQALVCQTNFNMPRRTAAGTDYNRVNLLMAVMEKRLGISLAGCDAYINVAGGMRVHEPALDLAIVIALLSSYKNRALGNQTLVFGEVGLTGEVRSVTMMDARVKEAIKMGYQTVILPKLRQSSKGKAEEWQSKIRLIEVTNIKELLSLL